MLAHQCIWEFKRWLWKVPFIFHQPTLPFDSYEANAFYTDGLYKKYILKKKSSVTIFNYFSIFLKRIDTKIYEVSIIVKKNYSGSFLIVSTITWIKNLYSNFSILIKMFWSDCVTTVNLMVTLRLQFQNQLRQCE